MPGIMTFSVDVNKLEKFRNELRDYIFNLTLSQVQNNTSFYNKDELTTLLTTFLEENYDKIFDETIEEAGQLKILLFNDSEGVEELVNPGICGTNKIHIAFYKEGTDSRAIVDCSIAIPHERLSLASVVAEKFAENVFKNLFLGRIFLKTSQIINEHVIITFGDD